VGRSFEGRGEGSGLNTIPDSGEGSKPQGQITVWGPGKKGGRFERLDMNQGPFSVRGGGGSTAKRGSTSFSGVRGGTENCVPEAYSWVSLMQGFTRKGRTCSVDIHLGG